MYESLCTHVFISLGQSDRLPDRYTFNWLSHCQTGFQSGHFIYRSLQQSRTPVTPHPPQHVVCSVFLLLTILIAVQGYLIVILICIVFLSTDDIICSCAFLTFTYLQLLQLSFDQFQHSISFLTFLFSSIYCLYLKWICVGSYNRVFLFYPT